MFLKTFYTWKARTQSIHINFTCNITSWKTFTYGQMCLFTYLTAVCMNNFHTIHVLFFFFISLMKCNILHKKRGVFTCVFSCRWTPTQCLTSSMFVAGVQLPSDMCTGTKGTLQSSSLAALGGALMPFVITLSLTSTTLACTAWRQPAYRLFFPCFSL